VGPGSVRLLVPGPTDPCGKLTNCEMTSWTDHSHMMLTALGGSKAIVPRKHDKTDLGGYHIKDNCGGDHITKRKVGYWM